MKNNMTGEKFLEKLKSMGVKNPSSPTKEELTLILETVLKNREIKLQTVKSYLETANIALNNYFDALKSISADNKKIGEEALALISKAIDILGINLAKKGLAADERSEVLHQINELTAKAVDIHHRQLDSRDTIVKTGGTIVVAILVLIGGIFGSRQDQT